MALLSLGSFVPGRCNVKINLENRKKENEELIVEPFLTVFN